MRAIAACSWLPVCAEREYYLEATKTKNGVNPIMLAIIIGGEFGPGKFGKGALGAAKGFDNLVSGVIKDRSVLEAAERWLGEGYREIAPGVYRSADNTGQFRMTASDPGALSEMSAAGRNQGSRLVAIVRRPYTGGASRHRVGLPPVEGEADARERLAVPRVLVLESRPDGVFLDRHDEAGDHAGDTWHESIEDAKAQALAEYRDNLGRWIDVPEHEQDAVAFALGLADWK